MQGERLTRDEAFDLVRRAVQQLTNGDPETSVRASDARTTAREILGRDSETLSERFFQRILRDAHDANVIDLRKRGDDYEVSMAAAAAPIADQLREAQTEAVAASGVESQGARSAAAAQSLRRGMGGRGGGPGRGRQAELPPELLTLGVIEEPAPQAAAPATAEAPPPAEETPAPAAKKRGRRRGGSKKTADASADAAETEKAPAARKAAKRGRTAAKKTTAAQADGGADTPDESAKKSARKRRGRKTASSAAEG
jgi:hypothetical protein